MAEQGWRSQDSIDFDGQRWKYVTWFCRRDWHGVYADKNIEVSDYDDLDKMTETVRRTARAARRLWKRFPEKVPGPFFDGEQNKHVWRALPEDQQPEKFRG